MPDQVRHDDWETFYETIKHSAVNIGGITTAATLPAVAFTIGLFGPFLQWLLYPVLVFTGIGGIAFGKIWLILLSEFGGRRGAGKAVGLGGVIAITGAAIGPPFFGHMVDATGSYRWVWLSLALVSALCAVLLLKEKHGKI